MRGDNVSICELESTIGKMKTKNSGAFVEWIPDNMMTTICKVPAYQSDISGTFIANSTA